MKLKKLIKYIDALATIRIWIIYPNNPEIEDDEPAFEGSAMEMPWYLTEYYLVEPEDNCGDEAICSYPMSDKTKESCIRITVKEP